MGFRETMRAAAAALTLAVVAAAAAGPARAADIRFDNGVRSHLAGLERLGGRPLNDHLLHGRAVVVAFFASWCTPCNTQFEHLKILQLAHAAEGLTIVAVDLREDEGKAAGAPGDGKDLDRFLGRHAPVFSVVRGTDETARLFGGVARLPALFVFDSAGRQHFAFSPGPGAETANAPLGALRAAVQNALGLGSAWLPEASGGPLAAERAAGTGTNMGRHVLVEASRQN